MQHARRRTQRNKTLGLVIAATCLIVLTACGSSPLPPKLTATQIATVAQTRIPLSVGVEQDPRPQESKRLLEDLVASDVFTQVRPFSDLPQADLVVAVHRYIHGDRVAVVPLFSILTLGIVPTRFDVEYGQAFTVRPGPQRTEGCNQKFVTPIEVDFSYEGKATLGWAATLINLSPNNTIRDVRTTDRYRQRLALAISEQAGAIERMLAEARC